MSLKKRKYGNSFYKQNINIESIDCGYRKIFSKKIVEDAFNLLLIKKMNIEFFVNFIFLLKKIIFKTEKNTNSQFFILSVVNTSL